MMFMKIYSTKKIKGLIMFDDLIGDMECVSPIVTELFLRGEKLNISLVFISQCYSIMPKIIRLNATHFIMKIPNKLRFKKDLF